MPQPKTTKRNIDSISAVPTPFNQAERQETTRSYIALGFVGGYLAIVVLLIVLCAYNKLSENTAKDYLIAIGTQLGFIIGFYFKSIK